MLDGLSFYLIYTVLCSPCYSDSLILILSPLLHERRGAIYGHAGAQLCKAVGIIGVCRDKLSPAYRGCVLVPHAEVREPSALLTPDQRFLRATFTCGARAVHAVEERGSLAPGIR